MEALDRLGDVSSMFRRNGEVVETEAWLQKMKAASLSELLFFMVVVIVSGLAFLLFLMLIERFLFNPGSVPPVVAKPPIWSPPAAPPGGTSPPPGWPPGYPYPPPFCVPPPSAPAPAPALPAPTLPTTGSTAIPLWVIQWMEFFVASCVLVYVWKRVTKRPKRPTRSREYNEGEDGEN
ncbi:hypothetical protein HK100_011960 [Physocladia obscura]|uniref:Uncharacterized protein n=1 Tax=Physocladia obscura TaxID=109957 RepID=A0AAD5XDP1_9FUNG|nr:hypothetical protein HK100_011960 [Physocladia obscura]